MSDKKAGSVSLADLQKKFDSLFAEENRIRVERLRLQAVISDRLRQKRIDEKVKKIKG
jgi:regulator of replication initiation timing